MKFIYLVPVLAISAALGASASTGSERPRSAISSGVSSGVSSPASATPPWLSEQWPAELGHEGSESDPHAGLYATSPDTASGTCTYDPGAAPGCDRCEAEADPHAGMYAGSDPHAGMYAGSDPHAGAGEPSPHGLTRPVAAAAPVERSRAANGKTVAEIFSARAALDQTRVTVRGTVVKLTEGVLGKTYLHLRDGTGSAEAGDDDLTVTTSEAFSIGETVEVEGQLAIDQDVGVGYSYPALLADASRVQR